MPLPVIAAVIRQGHQVLLCQRKEGALAGKWSSQAASWKTGKPLSSA